MFRISSWALWPLAAVLLIPAEVAGQAERLLTVDPASEGTGEDPEQQRVQRELAALQARIEQWRGRAREFRDAWEQAPIRLHAIAEEIAELSDRSTIAAGLGAPLPQLEAELAVALQRLAEAHQSAGEIDTEMADRAERRRRIPELLSQARERLRELQAEAPEAGPSSLELSDLTGRLAERQRLALEAELEAYESELASYDTRGALLAKRRDRAAAATAYFGALIGKLRGAIKDAQRRALAKQTAEAERLLTGVEGLTPRVRDIAREIADQNAALAELWVGDEGLVEKVDTVTRRLERARSQVSAVEADLVGLAAKVEAVGLADSAGTLLRRQRAEVPDVGMYRRFVRLRQTQIGAAQLQQIRLQEKREGLGDIAARVTEVLDSLDQALPDDQAAEAKRVLRTLFEHQRQYMDALVADYETYFQRLVDFDAEQRTLIERSEALIAFIDERVLWMPSGTPIGLSLLADAARAAKWLVGPRRWRQVGKSVQAMVRDRPVASGTGVIFVVLMLTLRPRLRRRLVVLSQRVDPTRDSDGGPASLEAVGLACLSALWLPATLLLFARVLGGSAGATLFVRSLAHGLSIAALYWGTLRLLVVALADHGVARVHAGWDARAAGRAARHLRWLTWATVPAVLLVFVFEGRGNDTARESLGRLAFIVGLLSTAVFCQLLTRPQGAFWLLLRSRRASDSPSWGAGLVQLVAVAGPLALCTAAALGFYWTALQFSLRQHLMVVFLFLLTLAIDVVRTWTRRAQRRLARDRAQRQAAQAVQAAALADPAEGRPSASGSIGPSDEQVDLAVVARQTGRLTIVVAILIGALGLSAIWADLVPAAGILREVELWQVARDVTSTSVDAAGVEHSVEQRELVPVTLADLGAGLLIGCVAWLLLGNLPGLFEVTLFRRLQPGERYAFATIVKYIIAVTGGAFAFDAIGIGWSSIQWLVAAVGLGLGIGLQEIFANFVSGLIILLERPIRVGDTVTVGGVSGVVTRIRTRATWITAFDRKELVVPNKEFVTSRLVNWSLSDSILRVDVPVGIAYGSDVQRAIAVLQQAAQKHRLVLQDPSPQVLFLSFGDSALVLELRAFVGDPDDRLPVIHDLHLAVNQALSEAGIEIAFPQLDLHVRDMPARLLGDGKTA